MSVPALRLKDLRRKRRAEIADEVLSLYERGGSIADEAKRRGVSPTTIYMLLIAENLEDWKAAHTARVLHQLEDAKQLMREAADYLQLAKGEKLAYRYAWELERLLARHLGPKQDPEPTRAIQININLRGGEKIISEIETTPA